MLIYLVREMDYESQTIRLITESREKAIAYAAQQRVDHFQVLECQTEQEGEGHLIWWGREEEE